MKTTQRSSIAIATLLTLATIPACQTTGLVAMPDAAVDPGVDGAVVLAQYTYTPTGCDYTVSTPEAQAAGPSEDVFGDMPEVSRVHVSWAGPSHTTFAVNWQSDDDTLASLLLYGTDEAEVMAADGPGGGVMQQTGHHILFRTLTRTETRVHEAHVCGLEPDTTYYYRVGGPGNWSRVFSTTTAPVPGSRDTFVFAVTGDSRGNEEDAWPISQRRVRDAMADFEVFSGDAVILATAQDQWDDFFQVSDGMGFDVQDLFSSIPIMMANGNHDALSVNFVSQTAFPQEISGRERAQGEQWYSFDYGNAHFVMLDDNDRELFPTDESTWLDADLAAARMNPDIDWVFAVHHRPFYTCMSTHSPDTTLRSSWQEIFDRHRVDAVFTGHNHVYERTRPIRGLTAGAGVVAAEGPNGVPQISSGNPSGTVYIVSAGVGAPLYEVSTACPTSFPSARGERTYVIVTVTGEQITFTVRNALTDALVEEFGWDKSM